MTKFHFTVTLAVLLAVVIDATDFIIGERKIGDDLACYESIHLPAVPGKIIEEFRSFNVTKPGQSITQISARDVGPYGRGGNVSVLSYGVGYSNVTLYLESQSGQPLDFDINIFAKVYFNFE